MSDKNHSFLKSYVKGEVLLGGWGIVAKLLGAVNAFIIISNLEVFKYGVYILVLSVYSIFSGFFLKSLIGVIFNDISRFLAKGDESSAKKLYLENFKFRVFSSLFLSLFLFFGANIVADFYDQDVASLFRILSPLFLIDAFYSSMKILFRARLKFGLIAFRPIVYKSLKLVTMLYFIYFTSFGMQEAFIAHIGASFVAMIIFIPSFIKLYNPWKNITTAKDKIMLRIVRTYGKWSLFSQSLSRSTADIRLWIIKFFINTEAVAVFSVAESLYGALKGLFPTATLAALIPHEIHDKQRSKKILIRGTKYLFIIAMIFVAVGFFIVSPGITIVFPQYADSVPLFQVLLLALFALSFRSIGTAFLVALRRQKYLFYINTVYIILGLLLPVILLHFFGLFGMAFERVIISVVIGTLIYWRIAKKEIKISLSKDFFTYNKDDRIFFKKLFLELSIRVKKLFFIAKHGK